MIVGVLQARVGSRRLPGKVLMDVCGQPMLMRQIDRLRRSTRMERLVVATTADRSDDDLASLCAAEGIPCHRGETDDVLARVLGAATGATHVVRLTGDCPLTDPTIVDRVIDEHLRRECDYTSNTLERTFPDGLDVEVIRWDALALCEKRATKPSEREHVTPYVYNSGEFEIAQLTGWPDRSAMRWTVDELSDLAFVRAVYSALLPLDAAFTTDDVLELLIARPHLAHGNAHIATNEGYARSIAEDPR